jgi:uncharacterized repeat protein (TIGR02543 family)
MTISGLTNSTTYQIKLRAVTPFGSGAASTALTATPGVTVYRAMTYSQGTLDSVSGMPSGATYVEAQTFSVAAAPTRTNFTFVGWSDGSSTYQPGATYTVAKANINLTAQWRQTSLATTSNSDIARVLTWNIVGSEAVDATVSSDGGNSSVRVLIPSNTFDAGTEVIFWRLTNQNASKNAIDTSYDYMVNLAVSWSIGDDVSSAKRVVSARNPIQLTITNSAIEKNATAWMIIGGVATKIGSATQNGQIQVTITEDPIITLANVAVANVAATKQTSSEDQRRLRDAAIARAKEDILLAVAEGRKVLTTQFQAAEVSGATDQNIESINKEFLNLSQVAKRDFQELEKVVLKYGKVDKVANHQVFYYSDLAKFGLVPLESKYKTSIINGLKKLQSSDLNTPLKIHNAADIIEKKMRDRASLLLDLIAKIRERLIR